MRIPLPRSRPTVRRRSPGVAVLVVCGWTLAGGLSAAPEPAVAGRDAEGISRALVSIRRKVSGSVPLTRAYEQAKALHRESPGRPDLAWAFARACFDRCEVLASKPVRIAVAREGVEACRSALKTFPTEAGCHYYLGLNLGILAQSQPLRALGHVREMESAWQASRLLDPTFDHAGADRSLGMLYAECPPPPIGVGSRTKARSHLAKAVELAPAHPGNRLEWVEYLERDGDTEAARREFQALRDGLPTARERFHGEAWNAAWEGWQVRIDALEQRLRARPTPGRKTQGS